MKLKKRKICLQEEDIQGSSYDNPYVSPSPILVADPVGQVTAHVTEFSASTWETWVQLHIPGPGVTGIQVLHHHMRSQSISLIKCSVLTW